MSLLPSWPTVIAGLVIGLAAGAVGMHTWDASTITGLKVDIANSKAAAAESVSVQSQAALKDFQTVAATINQSAQVGQQQYSALGTKLDTLAKVYKNAKPTVLSADCRPGTVRVQNIAIRAAAIDQTIAGSVPSK